MSETNKSSQHTTFHPVLPKLGPENRIKNFDKSGVWEKRESSELEKLSRSLYTERLEFDVNAIPDIWSRPILFEMALLDEHHPLHRRILGEWRGLLALFALKKIRRFDRLKVESLHITAPKDYPDGNSNSNDKQKTEFDFLSTIGKMLPQKSLANDSNWEHLYIVLFNGHPIAMTSPITLVSTATAYLNTISGVSWYDGKFLIDPITHLNQDEKQKMGGWVEKLKQSLINHTGIHQNINEFNKLLKLLDQFATDLGMSQDVELSNDHALGIKEGIFQYLDRPVLVSPEFIKQSQLEIAGSKKPKPQEALLLVDKRIAKHWGVNEKDIYIYNSIPLDRISPGDLSGDRRKLLGIQFENARWCTPKEFFTDKLVLIKQRNALPGVLDIDGVEELFYQDEKVTPIVPLTSLILPYLDTEDIANRLRFERKENEFTVYFNIPLGGTPTDSKDFEISKTFNTKKGEVEVLNSTPILDIWPDFESPHWKAYYTYFSSTGTKTFYATPNFENKSQRAFIDNSGEVKREINFLSEFPRIFDCKIYRIDPKNKRPQPHNVGIILINSPSQLSNKLKSFKIGIDFGTSGTNVYSQNGRIDPSKVELKERFFKVASTPVAKRIELYDYFLPGLSEEMPFLSIYHDFMQSQKNQFPLLDGHIYFLNDHFKYFAAKDDIQTDLKWGDKTERTFAHSFLKQLCLQCAAEAANEGASSIDWRFSYPTAFSREDEEAFTNIWSQITQQTEEQTGLKNDSKAPRDFSESIASARYFANDPIIRAPISEGAIFVDIGGRTSDISIWQGQNNELLAQTSLRFAGRDLFSYPIWKNTNFLLEFCDQQEIKALLESDLRANEIAFYAQLDAFVTGKGEELLKKLPSLGTETNVKEFKQLIALGISGLFYYIGLVTRELTTQKLYEDRLPNIYLGGNGSRLLHWLASGDYNPNSPITKLLKQTFVKAFNSFKKNNFEIQLSPKPKSEVAYGLVKDDTPLTFGKDQFNEGLFVAGESFEDSNSQSMNWDTTLSVKMIKSGIKISEKLKQLETFISTFNEHAKDGGIWPVEENSSLLEETRKQVNQRLANIAGTDEKEIRIEPLFLIGLRELLKIKVDKWIQQ